VTVNKQSPSILLVVNLYSDDDPATDKPYFDQLYLSNYATIQIRDELSRLEGVGQVNLLGQQDYSMRAWLDPDKLASRNLTADDVVNVVKEQNVQVAAGQIGQPPVPGGQNFQYTMTTLGRLQDPAQFEDIVLKTGAAGGDPGRAHVILCALAAGGQRGACCAGRGSGWAGEEGARGDAGPRREGRDGHHDPTEPGAPRRPQQIGKRPGVRSFGSWNQFRSATAASW
jgi:multidrug efflux pump